jgi:transposase
VSKDLHKPYALSCADYIPHAIEVADPFHVVKKLNETIDLCRKELSVASELPSPERKEIFRLNWVLRYKTDHQSPRNLESLDTLAQINEPLYKAYMHKEIFYEFFKFKPTQVDKAEIFLMAWIIEAFKSNLKPLQEFASYITRNKTILLNIILTERSSAISEGINRKIQVLKSMAYGYRNINYFMLKILQRCGVLGMLWTPASS